MKKCLYDVVFGLDHIEVYALSVTDAAILAVAQRISEGKSTTIDQIHDTEDNDFGVMFPCALQLTEDDDEDDGWMA